MLVWCMQVVGLNDEMQNQHAQVGQLDLRLFCEDQTLASNDDLTRYSSFCDYLVTNGAKDGIFGALRLVSCFKGPSLIPQHHLVEIDSYVSYLIICAKLQSKLLAHMQGEQLLPFGVHETCPYPLHMVNILGQATWIQMNFNSYLCIRVVINYQKGED